MKRSFELETYIAGAILSNAPIFIINYLLISSLSISILFSSILNYFMCFSISTLSGYLVARKLSSNPMKAGTITGVFSYIIYALIAEIFPSGTWDLAVFLGFLMGGCVGSKIWDVF
jgi:uncharacterized PurR-regulated membrane protein YhhQ (DUF165 family)